MNKSWQTKKLGEICNTSSGGTPSRKNKIYYEGDIPWVKSGELNFNTIRDTEEKITEEAISESSAKTFPKGTLLIALYGATVGKLAFLGTDAATNQAVCAIMPKNGLDNKYLYWYLFSKRKDLVGKSIGGAQPNISQTILKDVDVPVPPLPTQHGIVEKIEELFSELDNGVENLKKAQKQLKTYRLSVLKDAFEGKLTKEWREKQTDLPTPDELLQQIKAERKAHRQRELAEWEKEVEQWEKDGEPGRKPRKPSKPVEYEEITQKESDKFESIIGYWTLVRLGQISDSKGGHAFKSKNFRDSGKYQVLRIGNIRPNKIRFDESPVYLDEVDDKTLDKALLKKGDVVITLTGTRKKRDYGYAALITEDNLLLNQRIAYLRFYNTIDPKFFLYFAQTRVFQNQFFSNETGNVGQGNVSMSAVTESVLPAPSLTEQKLIIEEIESRFSIIDQLEQTIKENLQKAEALRQSILKKAFGGELVEG
ncbi:MAG: restriction endonuclease subunit S [Balneolaceae bacterium]